MKRIFHASLSLLLVAATVAGCKKKPDPDPQPIDQYGSAKIQFSNTVGTSPLEMNGRWYQNQNGDSFQVNIYKYYISNISLFTEAGNEMPVPNSYYLIDAANPESGKITMNGLFTEKYTKIRFLIGVDSARNVSGAQTGALDPVHGMFWTWNSGYIMAKLEGFSPSSTAPTKDIMFHTGGFSGQYNALRWVELAIPGGAVVSGTKTPNIHIISDVLEWFKSPSMVNFSQTNVVMGPNKNSSDIATNYADMFRIDHVD